MFTLLLATMMVPVAVVLLPSFQIIRVFRCSIPTGALIIPALATPFGIFLMRQYITSLPTALIEVANIDGASELRIFWSIIIPLSKPGMAALGIFTVMNAWNAFLWPLIVLRANEMRTLVVGLATVQSEFNINYGLVMAGVRADRTATSGPVPDFPTLLCGRATHGLWEIEGCRHS